MIKLIDINALLTLGVDPVPRRWCVCDGDDGDRTNVNNGDWYP